jgi:ketosteroid isomerase-like protein
VTAENVELLRGIYERWGRGDFRTADLYHEDFTLTLGPEFPDAGVHAGQEGLTAYMHGFFEPWTRLTITAEEMAEGGNKVLVQVLQEGTGELSGAEVAVRYFQLWEFAGPKPIALRSIMDETDARSRLESS